MTLRLRHGSQRGVSLVEALVALAVMAIGLLGVVGLQATLRANADVSRQRSEAVRIAQQRLEQLRGYSSLASPDGVTYQSITTAPGQLVPTTLTNTDFTLYQTVTSAPAAVGRAKMVAIQVAWRDRRSANDNQWVDFATFITGTPPDLAGALSLPAGTTRLAQPKLRHAAIPVQAQDNGDGSSSFRPLGGDQIAFTFNNLTGIITSLCIPASNCTSVSAYLLSGYVRFATGTQPTPALAEVPPPLSEADLASIPAWPAPFVSVQRTGSTAPPPDVCVHVVFPAYVAYYCAVPVSAPTMRWSGRSSVWPTNLATTTPDTTTSASRVKVCRYAPSASPTRNPDHPANYSNVGGALTNQNFLVITAGNGSDTEPGTAWTCPGDDTATPVVSSTWPHQP